MQALELRTSGRKTMREIAAELEIGLATAHLDVHTAMAELNLDLQDQVVTYRGIEDQVLDELRAKAMTALDSADKPSDIASLVTAALKVSERRSKLLGLDAPVAPDAGPERPQVITVVLTDKPPATE